MLSSLVDMSKDDCRKALRTLELETYGSMVAVLRAQGHFSSEKKKLLSDVANALSIPVERHKAEVRKAVNDDTLNCIAETLVGPNTGTEWAIEGRRPIPLLPRPPTNTVFTAIADECADYVSTNHDSFGPLSEAAHKAAEFPYIFEPASPEPSKTQARSVSPSGLIVLPSGAAIQMKREPEDDEIDRKRRKIPMDNVQEVVSPAVPLVKVGGQGQQIPMTSRTMPFPPGTTPLKIALPTSSSRTPTSSVQSFTSTPKQVIIVSSSGSANPPSILHKTLSVPMKTSAAKPTVMYPSTPTANIADSYKSRPKPLAANPIGKPRPNAIVVSQKPPLKTGITQGKHGMPMHTKIVVQQKAMGRGVPKPQQVMVQGKPGKPAVMTNVQLKTPQGLTNVPVQLRTVTKPTTMQLKQESGGQMKMLSISPGTKILPKPTQPVYMVTSSTTPLTMVTRTVPASCPPRVMTVAGGAQGVKWNQSPIGSKPLQAVHVMPQQRRHDSVVLVQKSASGKGLIAHTSKESPVTKGTTKMTHKPVTTISSSVLAQSLQQLPVTQNQSGANVILLDLSTQEKISNNAVLADILQASGILSEEDTKNVGINASAVNDDQEESKDDKDGGIKEDSNPITSLSIEEAVEMLNRSDTPETRALLSQAGIQISDEIADSEEEEQIIENAPVVEQEAPQKEESVSMKAEPGEVVSTRVLETNTSTSSHNVSKVEMAAMASLTTPPTTTIIPNTVHTISSRPRSLDIFTTALASANINLDSFMEEEDDPDPVPGSKDDNKLSDSKADGTEESGGDSGSDPLDLQLAELTGEISRD